MIPTLCSLLMGVLAGLVLVALFRLMRGSDAD